ncbi:IS200/IS605 family element transposase accessory protein TnpB [Methanoculleus sp. Afa-1]|uniref:IS200/IS605 family element transposase accessory protein TnpB n=1 Tax=Methanoculleus formosensis TaxID=2590886 RepID=A0A9E4ZLF6_9EURY|nr:transposase [Methanoculleus sp. Afa-1]MCT8337567.1 IS200/IS605 family element transposase accessory protein TnpB [Methanoculleus sp. Afa-1]
MALRVVSNYLRLPQKTFWILDTLAYHSKSMYNVGLYNVRQHYAEHQENNQVLRGIRPDLASRVDILVGSYLPYTRKKDFPYKACSNYVQSKNNENYGLLHSDNAQQTLRSVEEAYKSYFGLLALYRKGQLESCPRPPHYLPKDGRFKLAFPRAHLTIRNGSVTLGMSVAFRKQHGLTGKELTFPIPPCIKPHQIREVTILPVHGGKAYKIEFCYKVPTQPQDLDPTQYLAIDLGLNNVATLVDTATGAAVILDGKRIKSLNRWYNKENARLQSIKDKQGIQGITRRQARLLKKRDCRITEAMNRYANWIVDYALQHRIGTVILPRWDGIKDNINHGRRGNQNFVQVPYHKFRQKLKSKCEMYGIRFDDTHSEAYTSQVDALALDPIQKPPYGRSRRVKRGLYQSALGTLINADVNGALNHLRKVAGDSVIPWIIGRGRVNRPVRIRTTFEPSTFAHIKLLPGAPQEATAASPTL